jgi:predicted transcriptional regulator of viral defense system
MSDRERGESGEFAETVTRARVLDVFGSVEGPVITSTDVAEALDCSDETARRKLTRLHEAGVVDRRKTGRTLVWWVSDDDGDPAPVAADDPIFGDRPSFPSGRRDLSGSVDEVLYGGDA